MSDEVAIILPVYNEESIISEVLSDFFKEISTRLPCNVIVCEDGSTDRSKEILLSLANKMKITLVSEQHRKGYAKAIKDAFKYANADLIFFSDSDGQYDPSDFWTLYKQMPYCDMVVGRKIRRRDPFYRIILSSGFNLLARMLFGIKLHDIDCGFRLMKRKVVESVTNDVQYLENSFWAEYTIRAFVKGFEITEAPISHGSRKHGGTSIYQFVKLPAMVGNQIKALLRLRSILGKYPRSAVGQRASDCESR